MICFCHVLSERVNLKDYIGRICFYPWHIGYDMSNWFSYAGGGK